MQEAICATSVTGWAWILYVLRNGLDEGSGAFSNSVRPTPPSTRTYGTKRNCAAPLSCRCSLHDLCANATLMRVCATAGEPGPLGRSRPRSLKLRDSGPESGAISLPDIGCMFLPHAQAMLSACFTAVMSCSDASPTGSEIFNFQDPRLKRCVPVHPLVAVRLVVVAKLVRLKVDLCGA